MFSCKQLTAYFAAILVALGLIAGRWQEPGLAQETAQAERTAQSWSGWVGKIADSTCGVKHKTSDAKQCTLDCVKSGAKYTLVIGEPGATVYTLDGNASEFEKLAGSLVKVQGDLSGITLKVTKVESY